MCTRMHVYKLLWAFCEQECVHMGVLFEGSGYSYSPVQWGGAGAGWYHGYQTGLVLTPC